MKCKNCGFDLLVPSKFCPNCGNPMKQEIVEKYLGNDNNQVQIPVENEKVQKREEVKPVVTPFDKLSVNLCFTGIFLIIILPVLCAVLGKYLPTIERIASIVSSIGFLIGIICIIYAKIVSPRNKLAKFLVNAAIVLVILLIVCGIAFSFLFSSLIGGCFGLLLGCD